MVVVFDIKASIVNADREFLSKAEPFSFAKNNVALNE